ncbi:MAG: thiamine biosynthesis protein ThiS [Rickettsiales bacterium]|nr:thiamine biosynthesis protein ThiS [Rickettsiales bacterium]|tara:strand:+ start:1124 stop:1342 length:219 start_codon:yes stop_codon:yes gene_type:complete
MNQYYLVNGKRKKFSQGKEIYILDLVNEIFGSKKKKQLAVALNFKLVCKSKWRSTKIKQNDKIEIVSAFTGG